MVTTNFLLKFLDSNNFFLLPLGGLANESHPPDPPPKNVKVHFYMTQGFIHKISVAKSGKFVPLP